MPRQGMCDDLNGCLCYKLSEKPPVVERREGGKLIFDNLQ